MNYIISKLSERDLRDIFRLCGTGSKILCVSDGCRPACIPGQISFSCFLGVVGICDNGCQKYVCEGCISGGAGTCI